MKAKILLMIFLAATVHAELGRPEDVPEAGRKRIDGKLNDWDELFWAPLDQVFAGNPVNISNARWALQWDEDGFIYIAVQYDDADIVLQDSYVNSNAQDYIEIYVRGDNGSEPLDYSQTQYSAQHYFFGLSKDKMTAWKKLAATETFPIHNPTKVAISLEGNTFTVEIQVPLYDEFSIETRRHCEMTEPYLELEVGVDIAITDAGRTGFCGIVSENLMDDKATNVDSIALHELGE